MEMLFTGTRSMVKQISVDVLLHTHACGKLLVNHNSVQDAQKAHQNSLQLITT